MAEGKNKIIVYKDWKDTFKALTDEEAGKLIKHFFAYVNDENPTSDRLTTLLFEPIKATLKRDLKKWEALQGRNKNNGSLGGRPPKEDKPKITQNNPLGFSETQITQTNPEKGVSVIVSDSVIINKPPTPKGEDIDFVGLLHNINMYFGREFKVVNENVRKKYKSLLKQGYTKENIITAIKTCSVDAFHRDNGYKHCTVEYFSRPKTMDLYGVLPTVIKQMPSIRSNMVLDHD